LDSSLKWHLKRIKSILQLIGNFLGKFFGKPIKVIKSKKLFGSYE